MASAVLSVAEFLITYIVFVELKVTRLTLARTGVVVVQPP